MFTIISTGRKNNFSKKDDPLTFLNKIKKGEKEAEKESQKDFINYLTMIRKGNKTQEQEKTLKNLNILFNGRNDAIYFTEGYGSVILEAKRKAAEELKEQGRTGLKILRPKQMLQRLSIALARVKTGNNSQNLLNEIDKFFVLCIDQTKLLKKYTVT